MKVRYEGYKDSGVAWIGDIPAGWEVRRLKNYLDILSGYPFDSDNFTNDKSCMPLIRIRDITSGRAETYYKGDYPKEFVVDNDDLLVGMDGDFNVRWWSGGKALLNQRCCKIMAKSTALDIRFVYYVLPILLQDINQQTYATTVKHLSTFDIYGAKIPLPPLPEQRAIAAYLDDRCRTIDAYTASLQREAALARELKQALIAQAVTRGLDPSVPMKDSGVAWIGQVPAGWEVVKLRKYLRLCSERGHQDDQLLSVTREQGVIIRNTESKEENHNFIPADLSNYKYVRAGQFAINKMKAWQGSYGVSSYNGIVSPAYYVCDLANIDPHFFSIAIRSRAYVPFFSQMSKGIRVDQWDLSTDALKSIPFIEPPLPEQRAIAAYLDQRCRTIDEYTESLQREAALARELKQALIARAVTRGLNTSAPMKDSGVAWIGQVPAGWEVRRAKSICEIISGATPRTDDESCWDGEINWITPADYKTEDKYVAHGKRNISAKGLNSCGTCLVPKGSVIISKRAPIGTVAIAANDLCTNQGCLSCIPKENTDSAYCYYYLTTVTDTLNALGRGTTFKEISASDFASFPIPLPPLPEQRAIAGYLDERCKAIDAYVASLEREVSLVRELKARQIADCVTGKVRV